MTLFQFINVILPGEMDLIRHAVVEVWEGYPILRSDWLTDDDLVDVIELIPVLIPVNRRN